MRAATLGRGAAVVAALGVLGSVVGTAGARFQHDLPPTDAAAELVYLPDAAALRPLVLGYDNVLADLLWFRTISYFGQHYESDRTYPWLAKMCDIVTDLDPRAEHVYRFAGVILPWEANAVDEGVRLLEKGLRVFPDSWMLHYYLGMTKYFFRDDLAAAATHLGRAAELPDAPPTLAGLAAVLHTKQYGPETTLEFLRAMLRQAGSAQLREVIQRSLQDAQLAADLQRLTVLVATYRERFGHFPGSLAALVQAGLLRGVPPDPFGGSYLVDPETGAVRSSTGHVPREFHDSPRRAERLAGH